MSGDAKTQDSLLTGGTTDGAGAKPAEGSAPPAGKDGAAAPVPAKGDGGTPGDQGKPTEKPAEVKVQPPADIAVKLPDGIEPDEVLLSEFKPLAKELGLKSEGAQKLVDLFVRAQDGALKKSQEAWAQQQKEWVDAVKADSDFAGAKFDASVQVARKAIERFGSPALKEYLTASGVGNHPELVKLMYRVGQAIAEDSVAGASGGGAASSNASSQDALLRELYPTHFASKE